VKKIKVLLFITASFILWSCSSTQTTEGGDSGNTDAKNRGVIAEGAKGCVTGDCTNGKGVYVYENGDRYEGEFKDGRRSGEGVFQYANGDSFAGSYDNDVRNGRGVYIFKNGDRYEGDFKNGEREGKGVYTFHDGKVYDGEFIKDGQSGKGNFKESGKQLNCELNGRRVLCNE